MPTGEIAPKQAQQIGRDGVKMETTSPPSMSPINSDIPDKIIYYGIETLNKLVWKGWEAGQEVSKKLVLKNLSGKTLKLTYRVPETRYFVTTFPKKIFLTAGSSFTLPISFRPLENEVYDDKITFTLKDGNEFSVQLKAVLPLIDISIPINLDFKMCAVKDAVSITFEVYNTGDVDTTVTWDVPQPFVIEPLDELVYQGGSASFKATFKPENAFVYEVTAVCKFGPSLQMIRPTIFYGIGKYPHLLVSLLGKNAKAANLDKINEVMTELDFGQIPVETGVAKMVELHNLVMVRTLFSVERVPGMPKMETAFNCLQTQGVAPPMSAMRIPLTFNPNVPNSTYVDYFEVHSVGRTSRSIIKCIGKAVGPRVELGKNFLNFKLIHEGHTGQRTLDIINKSDITAVYQFEIDSDQSVFKFPHTSGVLEPNSSKTIVIKFLPWHAINYHRRVAFLVHNQDPIFLDLLGTCHSAYAQPAILRGRHLIRYYTHVERGLSVIAPDALSDLLKSGRLDTDENGCLFVNNEEDKAELVTKPSPKDLSTVDEYFNDGVHSPIVNIVPHVSLDVSILDFGNCQNFNLREERTVNITNHTRGKVTVQWITETSQVFSVSPDTLDIPPLKACSFRVTFKPSAENKLFGNELECYIFYKSLRDFSLVEDKTHCPPWCLTLKCLGHTFMPNNDTFLPHKTINPSLVVFPAVNVGESGHRTVVLTNNGDTPIIYDLTESFTVDKCKSRCQAKEQKEIPFSVKPNKGILKTGHQIFTICITPAEVSTASHDLLFRLNDNKKYDQNIHLCGSAETAKVLLDNEGALYFRPTCVGTVTKRIYGFKNISRIPLRFQWVIGTADKKVLNVEPATGIVEPNEWTQQTWTFKPEEEKKYVIKPTLLAWGQGLSPSSSGGKKNQFCIRAVGEGALGDIQAEETYIDFGDIVVGSSGTQHFAIYNNGSCSLRYQLLIDGTEEGSGTTFSGEKQNTGIELSQREGIIPARSKQFIIATIRPMRRVTYQYAIKYQLIVPKTETIPAAVYEPQHLIYLLASGVYPMLFVTDIRPQGSAISLSKKNLWNLFSIDNLNAALDADPSSEELMFNAATRQSIRKHSSHLTKVVMDFNFSAAPIGAEPFIVTMMFQNSGTVSCDWVFMFPKDIELEMGFWVDDGERNTDELNEIKVMENKFFEITPKKGTLKPGEKTNVTLQYVHTMIGTDRLPVLLKIARGREIMLNFLGVTCEVDRPFIHFPSNKHRFNPVPIGELFSPVQVYELYNGGAVPVKYQLDLNPLDIIKSENFDQPIFECLNPTGTIAPGRTGYVEWRFFPLEAKTYMVDIPIHLENGDSTLVTFKGIGYDKRIMGDTMPFSDEPEISGVPRVQKAEIPGQLAYLSMERISFGNVPLFCQTRRLVFVTNKSRDRSIFFEWHVTSQADVKTLNIYPLRGEIAPGDYKMCRITFQSFTPPTFYDLDLICEISDLHEYTLYKKQLTAWEAERERQMNEFTITEKDLHADMRTPQVIELVDGTPSGRHSRLDAIADGRPVSSDGELSKFKTLPPIRQLTEDERRLKEKQLKKKQALLWEKPQPIKPSLLHLGITARTHDTKDFQTNFPREYNHYFIDRTLSLSAQRTKRPFLVPSHMECSKAESSIVASILGSCLRDLLDDTYFLHSLKEMMHDPIPYFSQFKEKPSSAPVRGLSSTSKEATEAAVLEQTVSRLDITVDDVEDTQPTDSDNTGSQGESTAAESAAKHQADLESDLMAEFSREIAQDKGKQLIKKQPEFGNTVEQILENTLLNLMFEAMSSEYSIVSKPRMIAMLRKNLNAANKNKINSV